MNGGPAPVRSAAFRARRPGMDRSTKAVLFAAAGLSGLVVVGIAGWALTGRHDAVIPVIEADSRPVRVKPENAGGLQVSGAEDQVLGGGVSAAQGVAPAAETPSPQALRAKMGPQAPAPAAAQPPAAQPVPAQPAPSVSAPAAPQQPAASREAARPAAPAASATMVQLAAVGSEQAAQGEWQRLAKRMPDLLGDRRPVVQRADHDGRVIWRLRTGGFADIADATGFCARVRSKGGACSIASF